MNRKALPWPPPSPPAAAGRQDRAERAAPLTATASLARGALGRSAWTAADDAPTAISSSSAAARSRRRSWYRSCGTASRRSRSRTSTRIAGSVSSRRGSIGLRRDRRRARLPTVRPAVDGVSHSSPACSRCSCCPRRSGFSGSCRRSAVRCPSRARDRLGVADRRMGRVPQRVREGIDRGPRSPAAAAELDARPLSRGAAG